MTMESKMIAPQQAGNGGLKHGGPNYQSGAGTGQGPGGPGGGGGNAGTAQVSSPSKLFVSTILEPNQGDLDQKHESYFNTVMTLIADKTEKEAHDALIKATEQAKTHEEVSLGFLVCILSPMPDSLAALGGHGRFYRDLTFVNRDGLACVLQHLNHLVTWEYLKMYPATKQQLMWLIQQFVRSSVVGMDTVCWNLMRQVAGGDVSKNNLWLADILVDIFSDNRVWLDKHPQLVASVAYTYIRLVEDHVHHEKLREKEVRFVVTLIRERWNDVAVIGRDLLRILQYVAKVPEFDALWRDILYNPRSLSPTFSGGFMQLMHTRTSRRFLQSRITPEMEKKICFLTSQVKFGTHKRYQDWFQRQYLATTESQSLRCDLIRFIIGVIHPTNELLCSDIIPRWAVIGWLLTTCTSQHFCSNAKLALFYDWLFFEADKDNIMNIEPAILVMHHSMRPRPAVTATLLDFLCRIIHNFHPKEQEAVRNGIYSSLRMILDKRVLPSLSPLFDNPRLDKELRAMLRQRFTPFCGGTRDEESILAAGAPVTTAGAPVMSGIDDSDGDADGEHGFGAHAGSHAGGGGAGSSSSNAAKFSDDEDDEDADLHEGVEGVAFDGSRVKEEGRDSSDVTGSMGTHFDTSSSSMGVNSNTSASTSSSPIEDGKENHKPSLSTTTAPASSGSGSASSGKSTTGAASSGVSNQHHHKSQQQSVGSSSSSSGGANSSGQHPSSTSTSSSRQQPFISNPFSNKAAASAAAKTGSSVSSSSKKSDYSTSSATPAPSSKSGKSSSSSSSGDSSSKMVKDVATAAAKDDGDLEEGDERDHDQNEEDDLEEDDDDLDMEEGELDQDLKEIIRQFKKARSSSEGTEDEQCEIMDQLVKEYGSSDGGYVQCKALASALADLLQDQFEGKIFPSEVINTGGQNSIEEAVEDSIGRPLFVIFRALCGMTDSDPHRGQLLRLLGEFYALQPRVGYYLLYFLNASNRQGLNRDSGGGGGKSGKGGMGGNVYRDLCEEIDSKFSLDICLVNDMRQCQEDDVALFVYLIPDIYRNFSKHSVGNIDLLYLVVSCVDGRQVQKLVCHVISRDFHMFKKDSIQMALQASLSWETFEQYAFWQLLSAHDLPIESVLPLVPKLRAAAHSEALTSVLLRIKQERPTADMLKHLLSREVAPTDKFVSSCLTYWMQEHEDRLTELISNYLCKQATSSSSGSGSKRKRNHGDRPGGDRGPSETSHGSSGAGGVGGSSSDQHPGGGGGGGSKNGMLSHSAELTLGHLDQLRSSSAGSNNTSTVSFFQGGNLQQALQQARSSCTDTQKKKFMDLFALADSDNDSEDETLASHNKNRRRAGGGSNRNSPNRSSKSSSTKKASASKSASDDASSGDDEPVTSQSSQSKAKKAGSGGRSSTSSSTKGQEGQKTSNKSSAANRKRGATPRHSYKELGSTDENSSDEDDILVNKKTPKKRRKMSDSD